MRRREFIALAGGAATWPFAGSAQQRSVPTVGLLGSATPESYAQFVTMIREGLNEAGYVEGKNLTIEYRWAHGQYDRLPELVADLIRREVAVIITTGGNAPVLAAKAATTTIPIVFAVGSDPVKTGLVSNLSGSASNVTGVSLFNTALMPKRLQVMREALPGASIFAMLMNAKSPILEMDKADIQAAAVAIGVQVITLYAAAEGEPEAAFAEIVRQRAGGLLLHPDPVLYSRVKQFIELAARYAVPTILNNREGAQLGALVGYGPDVDHVFRQAGIYAGRILKGEKAGELPVQQPTKFELVINLKTAKALGLTIPTTLLARADEVIE
jgi:putative tryptophan/tyrosine transport system substrate-binding protein